MSHLFKFGRVQTSQQPFVIQGRLPAGVYVDSTGLPAIRVQTVRTSGPPSAYTCTLEGPRYGATMGGCLANVSPVESSLQNYTSRF